MHSDEKKRWIYTTSFLAIAGFASCQNMHETSSVRIDERFHFLSQSKLKQLEQEAHQAAGQQFLVSSSAQLRLVSVYDFKTLFINL